MIIPKLFQWILVLGSLMSIWLAYVSGIIQQSSCAAFHEVILVLPLYFLMCFACYSLAMLGYGVATFNDCKDAADELQTQIKDAQYDLARKGFKFSSDWNDK